MRRRAAALPTLLLIVATLAPVAASATARRRSATRSIGSAGITSPRFPTDSAATAAGPVLPFGTAAAYAFPKGVELNQPIVGMAASPTGHGYWLVASDGGVFGLGDARFFGSTGGIHLNQPIVGMAATRSGRGYWLVAADGGIFSFGDARFFGSTGAMHLNQPIVGMAASRSGRGYWLVARDGGIFSFGDARFRGSTGAVHLNQPIVGMAASRIGRGYWLVAADGGIFSFGDAHYSGSAGRIHLGEPVVGMAATPDGRGYWLVERFRPGVFSPALVAELNARAGVISASVLDLTTGVAYQYRPGQVGITCSIVKVEILGTLLAQAQTAGRSLTPTEQALATTMIEQSDNGAATTLYHQIGRAPAVQAFDNQVGMTATTPQGNWGITTTTAADQVTLLQRLVQPNLVLSNASRAYVLGLMEHVTPSQAWGVSAGVAPGTTVALKNGWCDFGSDWNVNSIGWVNGSGRNYLIAAITFGNPTEGYGIDSISKVAVAAWNALGH